MQLVLAKVIGDRAYLYGEEWGICGNNKAIEDGWYLCNNEKTLMNHRNKNYSVVTAIQKVGNSDVDKILGIHYGTELGLRYILSSLIDIIPKDLLVDDRYLCLKELVNIGVKKENVKDRGMLRFIEKLTDKAKYAYMTKLLNTK